jgi:mannose-6-phosphate isomerase class I
MIQGLLKIEPHFVEKIWGGNISKRWYGLTQSLNPIGEIWSACATEQFANDLQPQTRRSINGSYDIRMIIQCLTIGCLFESV